LVDRFDSPDAEATLPEVELGHYRPVASSLEELFESSSITTSGIPGYITEVEFAAQIRVAVSTIRRWRRQRYGPQAVAIGRKFYYREDAASTFAAAQLEKTEAAAEPPRRGRRPRKIVIAN
jgi:hypothetical protein